MAVAPVPFYVSRTSFLAGGRSQNFRNSVQQLSSESWLQSLEMRRKTFYLFLQAKNKPSVSDVVQELSEFDLFSTPS